MSDLPTETRQSPLSAGDVQPLRKVRSASTAVPWFDGWRIVTGVLMVLFLVPSITLFNAAGEYHGRVYHPPHRERSLQGQVICRVFQCETPESKAVGYYIPGLYLLAASGSFALATVARRSSALRRISTSIGVALSIVPALIVALVVLFVVAFLSSG